ncbi:MAG: hypothetical protein HP497_11495 [Nitrospira sp.]|nr:hypothetical protein [Nitrospira sp.]
MSAEPSSLAEFRRLVSERARQFSTQWEASRQLIERQKFAATVSRLLQLVQQRDLPATVKEPLLKVFDRPQAQRVQDLNGEWLKTLTGFPPAKALRALCIFFDLVATPGSQWAIPAIASEEVELLIRRRANPFDLLHVVEPASLLDLGAGDLSFAGELVEYYGPELRRQRRQLLLHCIDRLDPGSQLGAPLHPSQERLRTLQQTDGVSFAFYGNQDMFDLRSLEERGLLAKRYAIATCWAPATPTFAYDPGRLARPIIEEELRRTMGASRQIRYQGERALEVLHGDRALLFPPWKFEIVGPRALLNLLATRGLLCVLGAVDNQVFWELLAQLLEDPRYRPRDRPFTAATIPEIFGDLYVALARLPIGDSVELSELGTLRQPLPTDTSSSSPNHTLGTFRYVRISRGATFPGIPASNTARQFSAMAEEVAPWFLTLIPA